MLPGFGILKASSHRKENIYEHDQIAIILYYHSRELKLRVLYF